MMNNSPVIGIVGLQASGKTEVAKIMVRQGAERIRMGDIIWDEVRNRDLEVTGDKVGEVANKLREDEGPAVIARRCIPIIKELRSEVKAIIVDGIRSDSEVEVFKYAFGDKFSLISVESAEGTRYKRVKSRKREDDMRDIEDFRERDKRELEWGMGEAMEMADFKVINEGDMKELNDKIIEIFEEITGCKIEN